MAMPIFTVLIPMNMADAALKQIGDILSQQLSDYHVIVFRAEVDEPKFNAFYEKDFKRVSHAELMLEIKSMLDGAS